MSDVKKFTYLRSLVEGSAAMAISGLQLTGANYGNALEIGRERFAQKQIIINSYMDALLKITLAPSVSDLKGIREVVDSTEVHVRGIKALGVDSTQYGVVPKTKTPKTKTKDPENEDPEPESKLNGIQSHTLQIRVRGFHTAILSTVHEKRKGRKESVLRHVV